MGLRAGQNFDKDGFYTIESRFNGWHQLHTIGDENRIEAKINEQQKQYYNKFKAKIGKEFKSLRSKIAPKVIEIRISGFPATGENFVTKVLTNYSMDINIIIRGLMGSRIVLVPGSI